MNRASYRDYKRVCESRSCKIRREIDATHYKNVVRHYVNEYCKTCVLHKFIISELRKGGKL